MKQPILMVQFLVRLICFVENHTNIRLINVPYVGSSLWALIFAACFWIPCTAKNNQEHSYWACKILLTIQKWFCFPLRRRQGGQTQKCHGSEEQRTHFGSYYGEHFLSISKIHAPTRNIGNMHPAEYTSPISSVKRMFR